MRPELPPKSVGRKISSTAAPSSTQTIQLLKIFFAFIDWGSRPVPPAFGPMPARAPGRRRYLLHVNK